MVYQKYTDLLTNTEGSLSDKVSALIMHYSDEWGWQGSDSIIADMLDSGLDLHSTIAILEAALHHECQSETFQAAVQAILDYQMQHDKQTASHVDYQHNRKIPLEVVLTKNVVIS